LKFLGEHNFFCYISILEHNFFSISPLLRLPLIVMLFCFAEEELLEKEVNIPDFSADALDAVIIFIITLHPVYVIGAYL